MDPIRTGITDLPQRVRCVDWTLMDTKSHQDLRQLEGQRLSHDLSHAFSDNSVRSTTQEQTPTFPKSSDQEHWSRQNAPTCWHWENEEPII